MLNLKNFNFHQNKKMLGAIALLILSFIIFIFSNKSNTVPQEVKVVEVNVVSKKAIHQTIKLTGKIRAKYSTNLNAQFPGIFNIIVPAGTKVTKGTIIAKIISLEIEKRFNLLSSAEIIAKEQFERGQKLFKTGAFSKADLESLENKWISAQKDLADTKHNFDKLQIAAPFDGIIGTYKQKDGKQLTGNEMLVNFYDPTNVTVDFDIPARILPHIEVGQNLVINHKIYQLKNVQKMLEDEKHMSPASVDIQCDTCIIGEHTGVELYVNSKNDVVVIPNDAIVIRGGVTYVYIISENKTQLRKVEIGMRQRDEIEVISGLEPGEVIVSRSVNRLYPEAMVKIHNNEQTQRNQ